MEYLGNSHGLKSHSTTRPPLFDRSNYNYWKFRIMIYRKSTNTLVQKVIKEGYIGPTNVEGTTMVPKLENEWDDDDYKKEGTHAKAMNAIMCYHSQRIQEDIKV